MAPFEAGRPARRCPAGRCPRRRPFDFSTSTSPSTSSSSIVAVARLHVDVADLLERAPTVGDRALHVDTPSEASGATRCCSCCAQPCSSRVSPENLRGCPRWWRLGAAVRHTDDRLGRARVAADRDRSRRVHELDAANVARHLASSLTRCGGASRAHPARPIMTTTGRRHMGQRRPQQPAHRVPPDSGLFVRGCICSSGPHAHPVGLRRQRRASARRVAERRPRDHDARPSNTPRGCSVWGARWRKSKKEKAAAKWLDRGEGCGRRGAATPGAGGQGRTQEKGEGFENRRGLVEQTG